MVILSRLHGRVGLSCLASLLFYSPPVTAMSMGGNATKVPAWFASLPISDSRCRNDSCKAFKAGHTASQNQISWASQFLYGHYVTWYYLVFIGLFMLVFAAHSLSDSRTKGVPNTSSVKPGMIEKVKALIRSFSYRRVPGRLGVFLALPSAGVLLWMTLATVAAGIMSFIQHPYYRSFRGYGSPPLGVRTGLMAAALFPITIALSGKVNIITMLTGFGYEKLNVWHRYVGYLMFILSTIHTIPFLLQESRETGPTSLYAKFHQPGALEISGAPAWALSFALAAFSLPIFRRKCYEVFVQSHIWMAIAFFGLCFWHFAHEGDSWSYLWATLALWLFQLLARTFWKTSAFKITETWFTGLPTSARSMPGNMVRLDVLVPDHWTWRPGQHVFLRFPKLNPLDNHPFTIASVPHRNSPQEKQTPHNVMTFLVRAQGGSTKHMARYLSQTPDAQLSTIVDGPYGTIPRRYERCVEGMLLVAGGGGITSCLPWLLHMSRAMHDAACVTRSVRLVWMVRSESDMAWVADELRGALDAAPPGRMGVDVYVTDGRTRSAGSEPDILEVDLKGTESVRVAALPEVRGVSVRYDGRPDIAAVMDAAVGAGRTAVLGCGPEGLKIGLSNAVAALQARVLRGEAREIMLHTETFDW